jgi:hypothetical protein
VELGEVLECLVDWLKRSFPAAAHVRVGYPVLDAGKTHPVLAGTPQLCLRELSRSASSLYKLAAEPTLTRTIDSTVKAGTGSATLTATGSPTSSRTLVVEVTTGGELVAALGKFSDDGGVTWSPPVPLAADVTAHGVKFHFVGGVGTDFVVGDRWTVETTATTTGIYTTHAVRAPLQLDVLTATPDEFYGKPASTPPVVGLDALVTLWIQNLVGGPDGNAGLTVGDGQGVSFAYGGGAPVPTDDPKTFHFAYTLYLTGELELTATQELVDGFNFQPEI